MSLTLSIGRKFLSAIGLILLSSVAYQGGYMGAKWDSNNMACKATWSVLSIWMKQVLTPFDANKSPAITMGELRYWPKSGIDPSMMPGLAFGMAHQFLLIVQDHYSVQSEDPTVLGLSIIREVQKVFAKQNATLADLAATLDSVLLFAGETK